MAMKHDRSDSIYIEGDREIMELANKIGDMATEIVTMGARSAPHVGATCYILASSLSRLMQPLAVVISDQGTKDGIEHKVTVNGDTMLMAALLAYRICDNPTSTDKGDGSVNVEAPMEFGPHIYLKAMQDFEKLTGRQPDDQLDPKLVKAAREAVLIEKSPTGHKFFTLPGSKTVN